MCLFVMMLPIGYNGSQRTWFERVFVVLRPSEYLSRNKSPSAVVGRVHIWIYKPLSNNRGFIVVPHLLHDKSNYTESDDIQSVAYSKVHYLVLRHWYVYQGRGLTPDFLLTRQSNPPTCSSHIIMKPIVKVLFF